MTQFPWSDLPGSTTPYCTTILLSRSTPIFIKVRWTWILNRTKSILPSTRSLLCAILTVSNGNVFTRHTIVEEAVYLCTQTVGFYVVFLCLTNASSWYRINVSSNGQFSANRVLKPVIEYAANTVQMAVWPGLETHTLSKSLGQTITLWFGI